MADLPSTARVVIIGGGAVGCSTLYHLTQRGWSDVLLLEKSELTAGSTWHAAGNCPTFSGSWTVMQMQAYSIDLFERLGDEVGYPINYHQTGAVRLAHTKERMREFEHVADMAASMGRQIDVISVDQLKEYVPQMEGHDLVGGLWDARDGDIDPSQVTQAYAKGARDGGAKIIRSCPVTDVTRDGDEWVIHTPQGDVRCEFVVNAAGYYAPDIGNMFLKHGGRPVPQTVMAHQYLVTEEIEELKDVPTMPMIRDPDSSYYLRQEKHGLLLGPYEKGGRIHWRTEDDQRPDDFSFQLFPDDLERIESYIEDACERVPLLGSVGLQRVINGPIPYAPDGLPLIGPMPGVEKAFEATAFTFGIIQSGGAGKMMAEWIIDGETEWDAWPVDPRRYTSYTDQDYCDAKGKEIYDNEYAIHFAHYNWPEGRNKRLSSLHAKHEAAGAVFGVFGGWERPVWFAKDGDNTDLEAAATYERRGPWFDAVGRECAIVRDECGVIDLTGLTRYALNGPGAGEWLETVSVSKLPKVGRTRLAYFKSKNGKFQAEMTITRRGEDDFLLMTAAVAEWKDLEMLQAAMPADAAFTLTNVTEDTTIMLVTGPKARDVVAASAIEADLEKGWLTHQTASVNGVEFDMLRVSFAGELGWEMHMPASAGPAAYDSIIAAGGKPVGMYALDSMRLEKGYMAWGHELNADYTLAELGVPNQGEADKRVVSLVMDDEGDCDAAPLSSVWQDGKHVGLTSSAGWGHRTGKAIALAMIDKGIEGQVEVEIFGTRHKATIQPNATLWDADNARIKA
ncbi:GcvT family protein [Pontivivens insulae]|uniref:4-methylaminobutanoate oxidase (Formaldehyde-forming) n=1 Tax=Pontivivens insulae TaxID=1639689 RepID=A0A2R8ADF5_9RHOB|nr:FAD-dependent oxidoreductase [Pontivivens insulae]RED14026.1 dimethylglycine dehydrogenase [Pontivivens insulae]SPF30100.1 4-methylaminobutanoate oxidase (formaldehyde-forming) [Pontivivens insulae]